MADERGFATADHRLFRGPMRPRSPCRSPLVAAAALSMALSALVSPAAAVDWSQAEPVIVTAKEYAFGPNHLTFKNGVAYRLRIENSGSEMHEFAAPDF